MQPSPSIPTIVATLIKIDAKLRRESDPETRKFFQALKKSAINDLKRQKARLASMSHPSNA